MPTLQGALQKLVRLITNAMRNSSHADHFVRSIARRLAYAFPYVQIG